MVSQRPAGPDLVCTWVPRADEYDLARSLGLVSRPLAEIQAIAAELPAELAVRAPGARLVVGRWHIWRVVRELARLGLTATPPNLSVAYAALALAGEERRRREHL